ncbi:DUF2189 domain-containing protein [Allomesorhizobium camelthorni]|uniref:DUF2189 domain-containing protein n=1 Tax=Allomesorhizobium camelthorni TaxID=475069 RepID=A0A6G4W5C0_9HYPH|nr:DUF2189 domain-containing protein [Mesorhizobium camelthorni]NGO49945.1 DUF2189 domain-containing protein [Mesorhizobium camelthorni]
MANFHVLAGSNKKKAVAQPTVRQIKIADVFDALRRGFDDFWEKPSHYVFLCLIYPVIGVILITWTSGGNALQLIYPLITGFALLGPLAALGLYEISRRRELNLDSSWTHALEVRNSPAIPSIIAVGVLLLGLFVAWLLAAQALFNWLYGADVPTSITAFVSDVLTTERGWTLILLGNAIGFLFALVVLSTTVVAFPLLLDRDVGAYAAIETSARVMIANPVPIVLWGLIVAIALVAGSLPLFVGLAIVIPVLGHSTWHLYRKVVETPPAKRRRAQR